jgi:dTDP-4-dehydrorhamnose reductase
MPQKMEHFSDGLAMSWYDLAKRITQIKVKEIASEALNLKANRPKNTALQ